MVVWYEDNVTIRPMNGTDFPSLRAELTPIVGPRRWKRSALNEILAEAIDDWIAEIHPAR